MVCYCRRPASTCWFCLWHNERRRGSGSAWCRAEAARTRPYAGERGRHQQGRTARTDKTWRRYGTDQHQSSGHDTHV